MIAVPAPLIPASGSTRLMASIAGVGGAPTIPVEWPETNGRRGRSAHPPRRGVPGPITPGIESRHDSPRSCGADTIPSTDVVAIPSADRGDRAGCCRFALLTMSPVGLLPCGAAATLFRVGTAEPGHGTARIVSPVASIDLTTWAAWRRNAISPLPPRPRHSQRTVPRRLGLLSDRPRPGRAAASSQSRAAIESLVISSGTP